ncbi:hypothetical protein EP837_03752 (plasmid) [Sphingobium sp. EP60837]|nr:hypothetical protein EP837_03752 [Sphingobium sp. EP60837]
MIELSCPRDRVGDWLTDGSSAHRPSAKRIRVDNPRNCSEARRSTTLRLTLSRKMPPAGMRGIWRNRAKWRWRFCMKKSSFTGEQIAFALRQARPVRRLPRCAGSWACRRRPITSIDGSPFASGIEMFCVDQWRTSIRRLLVAQLRCSPVRLQDAPLSVGPKRPGAAQEQDQGDRGDPHALWLSTNSCAALARRLADESTSPLAPCLTRFARHSRV